MPTLDKAGNVPRSAIFTPKENELLLALRALYEKRTGQSHPIKKVIALAVVAHAKANRIQ